MDRWKSQHIVILIVSILLSLGMGVVLAYVFKLQGAWLLSILLACVLICMFVLWFRDFKRGSQIIQWLADDHSAASHIQLKGHDSLWVELVRRVTRLLRAKDNHMAYKDAELQQFLEALQAMSAGVALLNEKNCLIWANASAARLFDLSIPQDYLQHITNLVRSPEFFEFLNQGQTSSNADPLRLTWGKDQKGLIEIQLVAYGSHHKLLLIQDITQQDWADQMRKDFVANVSHEIRTPLTVLMGFIETMQQLPLEEKERQHYLDLMAQQSGRIHYLINDLLTLARLEGSPAPDMNTWVDVYAILNHVKQAAQELSAGKHHLIFSDIPKGAYGVAGSFQELVGALTNLVANAIRYTPENSHIDISWQMQPDGRGAFSVKDNGPGIEPEHLNRLAERFYRVDKSRSRHTGGTGLGLSIVKHTMQRHGGELSIQSELGKGATFQLLLPAKYVKKQVNT